MARRPRGEGRVSFDARRRRLAGQASFWADGRRRRVWVSGRTRTEAARKLRAVLGQLDQGQPPPTERLTVGAYLRRWLETARQSLRPRTHHRYTAIVERHLLPALGRLPLARLSPLDVQRFLAEKRESGLSPATVRFLHAVLRRALGQAEK